MHSSDSKSACGKRPIAESGPAPGRTGDDPFRSDKHCCRHSLLAGSLLKILGLLNFATDILRWGWVAAEATLLALLFHRRLARGYRWFVTFLLVEWGQMTVLLSVNPGSKFYGKCWAGTEILLLVALALAVLELTKKILEHYPFVRDSAHNSFGMMFTFGAIISAFLLTPFAEAGLWQPAQTYYLLKVLRWESLTVFAFLVAQVLWFKLFPISMRRNVALHRWLLALYGGAIPFGSVFLYDFYERDKNARTWINLAMMAIQICLLIVWCLWFTEQGEDGMVAPPKASEEIARGPNGHLVQLRQRSGDESLDPVERTKAEEVKTDLELKSV